MRNKTDLRSLSQSGVIFNYGVKLQQDTYPFFFSEISFIRLKENDFSVLVVPDLLAVILNTDYLFLS